MTDELHEKPLTEDDDPYLAARVWRAAVEASMLKTKEFVADINNKENEEDEGEGEMKDP